MRGLEGLHHLSLIRIWVIGLKTGIISCSLLIKWKFTHKMIWAILYIAGLI
jgi:hypothetical protein